MPNPTHEELQQWFKKFSKAIYEKVNIDITQKEDLGRLKIWYFTKWEPEDPHGPEGDFQYACIPHNELEYVNPAPGYEHPQERLQWMKDNLEVPVTDEQIAKLMEMSKKGTLMAFAPGASDSQMQQVYTDEFGNITVSLPMNIMDASGKEDVPEHLRLPLPPENPIAEPNPATFGLTGFPAVPVKPENMNPSFLSWLGYILGFDTDYAKMVRYEKDVDTYEERYNEWFDGLDDRVDAVREFKAEKHAREQYLQQFEEYRSQPLAIVSAIDNGNRALTKCADNSEVLVPFKYQEMQYLKNQHRDLPQGKLFTKMEEAQERLQLGNRTKDVVRNLLGHQPEPGALSIWGERKVFRLEEYMPKSYDLPRYPQDANVTREDRTALRKKYTNLAEITSFAALCSPDIAGNPVMEGYSNEDTAKLNYSMILNNLITQGRPQSNNYMVYLEPARQKGREALEAYHNGDAKPMAELLRESILQTNREAACLSSLQSEHAVGTLYLIDRMWNTIQNDPKLKESVHFTAEETEEILANVAMHKTMAKMFEAKAELMKYALHQREMTPEEMKQYGCDLLFGTLMSNEALIDYNAQTKIIQDLPDYKAAMSDIARVSNPAALTKEMADAAQSGDNAKVEAIQQEIANIPKTMEKAQLEMNILEFKRPVNAASQKLLDEEWVNNYKNALMNECSLDKMATMNREELGKLAASSTAFKNAFAVSNAPAAQNVKEVAAPVKEEAAPMKEEAPRVMG